MCGIFGVISAAKHGIYSDEAGFIKNALIAGAIRGEDGTGLYFVSSKDTSKVEVLKRAGNPYWLLTDKRYHDFEKRMVDTAQVVVGHNRFSTRGKNSDANTHPFQEGPITMVHNGTINTGLTYPKGVEVDSHALTIAIANEGVEIFSKIYGAYVCIWHDARDGTLNIAKNYERPLSMLESKGSLFFASEAGMLMWLVARNQKAPEFKPVEIENGKHYKFVIGALGDPEVTPLPEKKPTQLTTIHTTQAGATGKTKTKKEKVKEQEEAFFQILRKRVELIGDTEIWTHFCRTSEGEACYFKSKDMYSVGHAYYQGTLTTTDFNMFPEVWGENIPWYRIQTRSIVPLDGPTQKPNEPETKPAEICLQCDSPIPNTEVTEATSMQVSEKKWRLMCKECASTFEFIHNKRVTH